MRIIISSKTSDAFLALVRLGVGHRSAGVPAEVDWPTIKALATRHGLSAIVMDGIEKGNTPPREMMLQWIGEVMQGYEQRYELYKKTIGKLAKFYSEHGYRLMVLKGYGLSLNYPRPEHRPCGDIDIWVFGKQKEADEAIARELKIPVDYGHHHHTVFGFRGFTVENHYDFLNVHYGHRNDEIEKLLKEQAQDDSNQVEVDGQKVCLPNANLHALFVLRHALHNFASTGMNMRQVLDWAFFMEKHGKEVDWDWLMPILRDYHMMDFMNCINAICVGDLGFKVDIFPSVQFNPDMKTRVLADILSREFSDTTPRNVLKRIVFKCRRWQANAWKQDLCYGDSRAKAFWQGVWSHLIKPSMI